MKEQYKWNYNIKIKTKEGTYEYEKREFRQHRFITRETQRL